MVILNKYLLGILTAAILLGASYFFGYKSGLGNVITNTVEVKGNTEVVERYKIITVTKIVKPDGTVEETTKTEDKDSKSSTSSSGKNVAVTPRSNKYSLGLFAVSKLNREEYRKLLPGVSVGYNLGKDTWVKLGYVPADNMVMMGIEIQF